MGRTTDRDEEIRRLRGRYQNRGKEGKSRLLDEFCEHWGYDRKYAIKLLAQPIDQARMRRLRRGPEPTYQPIQEVIERVWQASEQLCGKRLQPALALWLPHYNKHFGKLLPSQKKLLEEVSAATLDRMLARLKAGVRRRLCSTKPGTLLKKHVPIQGEAWDQRRPGFLEADSVAHCGSSLAGDFVWSLTYTCLGSSWTEGRAVWNRGYQGVLEQTQDVEKALPFPILGMDFDNGGEWLNWHLIRYLQQRAAPVRVCRSRPYHKDDNAHVEQKNWMWSRQLLGYGRLEDARVVPLINALYKEAWGPLQNFFLPSTRLVEKHREGSRWVRRHDRPQTAYQRLQASGELTAKASKRLREEFESLDPFALTMEVERRLKPILRCGEGQTVKAAA